MLSPETLVSPASERIHTILDKLHSGLLVQDRHCAVEFVNQAFCDLFRLSRSPESLRGLSAQQMLPLLCGAYADPQAAAARLVAIVHADQPVHGEEVAMQGGAVMVRDFIPIHVAGEAMGHIWVHRDITQHRQAEVQMRLAARLFDRTGESVVITDADHVIQVVNAAFERDTGYTSREVVGQRTRLLASGQHGVAFYEDMHRALDSRGWWQGEIWNRHRDGQMRLAFLSINAVPDEQGAVQHYIGVYSDPGRYEASQRRIEYLATHDDLTGLPNRFLFNDRVRQAIGRASERGEQLAVMFIDLDEFKLINDTLGHAVGDELLQLIAQRLRDCLRGCDTVARLGGDEFAVLIEHSSLAEAEAMARRVVELLGAPMAMSDRVLYVGASLGVGMFPANGRDSATLLQVADVAMYAAKAKGKRTYHFYTSELQLKMDQQLQLEMGLRWAIERDELRLLYQPQVHLVTGEVVGVEPLVRWQRPGGAWLMPAAFIPVAERNGLIDGIGLWVAREACRQVVAWQAAGYQVPRMSINVSAAQFRHPGLAGLMARLLAEHGLDPSRFVIELTESALMADPESAHQQLRQIRQAGLRVSIDDFGTGHSSLSCLRRYPLDELKVDRSFIADLEHSTRDLEVLRSILTLSRALELDIVVEGVETRGQLALLRELDCQVAQGFLFSRPVSAEAAVRWLPRVPAGLERSDAA
ncbi:EAL domain-containing protein [Sphaerotilus montanus]|jgi:two-component system CheB/CheR fusion protein|uniref:Diguanylate cyclase (GGDEF)-like protein/PAS domain S-box-containing protein n=1 Tax=Sphaerotilus montanus TaxID=522889 RepID=A0A7Y9QUV1_9BURK|nr:bifunctional diguanylate cyclase/phosphodiesterase [Sphaerotilus montanus]NYG31803.1 diguanylate cyclase (GGDEF)-like protein/PAS domain S-box-containing protein [Sphaerotilus montanus]NZD58061.1 EAL domain-containing protein [Sphaerotilus montanus]